MLHSSECYAPLDFINMPKNKFGGSKAKKAKNTATSSRQLQFKEELEDYAIVQVVLGSGKMKVLCYSDNTRGSMYKKVWIVKDDIVLISLREYQDSRCDIIFKYTPDEVRMLKSYGEIQSTDKMPGSDESIEFGEENVEFGEENVEFEFDIDEI
jgi:translation initiation factor 1A